MNNLDLAVALCTRTELAQIERHKNGHTYLWLAPTYPEENPKLYTPSTNWAQGGQLIEDYRICIDMDEHQGWLAAVKPYGVPIHVASGATPLEAAMKCLVLRQGLTKPTTETAT